MQEIYSRAFVLYYLWCSSAFYELSAILMTVLIDSEYARECIPVPLVLQSSMNVAPERHSGWSSDSVNLAIIAAVACPRFLADSADSTDLAN